MKLAAPAALVVVVSACLAEAKADPAPADQALIESPVGQMMLAVKDLAVNINAVDAPYIRYISFLTVPKAARSEFRKKFRYVFNQRSAARSIIPEIEVDGPDGSVQKTKECSMIRISIQDAPNWTRTAWVLVADRDYLFRERPYGLLPHIETQFGRFVTGIEQNEKTLAAGFILNGYQLFRDFMDIDRSPSGLDILYGVERHPDAEKNIALIPIDGSEPVKPVGKPWPGGKWPPSNPNGQYYPAGSFYVESFPGEIEEFQKKHAIWKAAQGDPTKTGKFIPRRPVSVKDAGKGIADFPKTLDDFRNRWGSNREQNTKKFRFDPTIGGIAAGADSDEKTGSYVAVGGDRAVEIEETGFGFGGTTFDSFKSANGNDQLEKFLEISFGDIKFDGGESLYSLPNGSQADFLFGGDKARVAIANTKLARITNPKIDSRYQDVRSGSCFQCHAQSNGFNSFVERFRETSEGGVRFHVKSEHAQQVRDFFMSWDKRVKRWRLPYSDYLELTTSVGPVPKPWTGAQAWEAVRLARDYYDLPVGIETAAAEYGMPVEELRQKILGKNEASGPIQTRLNMLAVGKKIPRQTWEANTCQDLSTWLDLVTPVNEKIKAVLSEKILEDAIKKFGQEKPK